MSERIINKIRGWNEDNQVAINHKQKRIAAFVKEITELQKDIDALEARIKENNEAIAKLTDEKQGVQ